MKLKNGYFQYKSQSGCMLDLSCSGVQYSESRTILVCFSGAVTNRQEKSYPFFSGAGLSSKLKVPCISISDSSLSFSKKLNLAWYAGNADQLTFQRDIAKFVDEEIPERYQVILLGGSGGGFASLAIGALLERPADIFVWNPQTSITEYASSAVFRYISIAFPEVKKISLGTIDEKKKFSYDFFSKCGICHDLKVVDFSNNKRMIIFQNQFDNHFVEHFLPFVRSQGEEFRRERVFYPHDKLFCYVGLWGGGACCAR